MKTLVLLTVPVLCAGLGALLSWVFAARRSRHRDEAQRRALDEQLMSVAKGTTRSAQELKEQIEKLAHRSEHAISRLAAASSTRQLEDKIDSCRAKVDSIDIPMPIDPAPQFARLATLVENQAARSLAQIDRALGEIAKRLGEQAESVRRALESIPEPRPLDPIIESIARMQSEIEQLIASVSDDLNARLALTRMDARRGAEAVEGMRLDTIRRGLPWEVEAKEGAR